MVDSSNSLVYSLDMIFLDQVWLKTVVALDYIFICCDAGNTRVMWFRSQRKCRCELNGLELV